MATQAALITGAAVRVGKCIALELARHGYDIALHYHSSESEALGTQQEIRELGCKCEIFFCDLTKIGTLNKLLDEVFKAFPDCSALVNNASVFERMEYLETTEEFFDEQFAVNFKAPFFLTQGFAKKQPKCSVVNIVDAAAMNNGISHFSYLLSKKAFHAFTPMAARALAPKCRVNAVLPGTVLPSAKDSADYIARLKDTLPAGRLATPEEVAGMVRYALENETLNGQCLFADGGAHLL